MNYKCDVCHDSGSKNQTGDYLDCPACDMPMIRKALNDFVKSLGPTHPEDVALAIHQRALAMAPKQEAPAGWKLVPAEITHEMREAWARAEYTFAYDGEDHPGQLYQKRHQYRAMLAAAPAAPAAANGALPELPEPLEIDWSELHSSALGCGVEDRGLHDRYECAEYGWQDGVDKAAACVPDEIYDADKMRAYGQACAAAGPDAALVKALGKIAKPTDGPSSGYDFSIAQSIARAALSGAKGN